jgi:hypothetical protein
MTAKAMAASTPSGAFDALADRVTLAAFHPPYERPVPGSLVANAMVNRGRVSVPRWCAARHLALVPRSHVELLVIR